MKRVRVSQEMPGWARLVGGLMAVGLLGLGVVVFLAGPGGNWKLLLVAFIAVGLGIDLLVGALRARWPVSALFWIVPP